MRMGRIGDGDVHAAYVEFRAKESDKVRLSLYCTLLYYTIYTIIIILAALHYSPPIQRVLLYYIIL